MSEFVPLRVDRQEKVTREVASARFSLPLPEHPGEELDVRVALIRDLSRQVPDEQNDFHTPMLGIEVRPPVAYSGVEAKLTMWHYHHP